MLLPRTAEFRPRRTLLNSGFRRAATTAAALTLLAGPLTSAASAQPQDGAGLPAELVAAVTRDLRMSPDEYLRRADLAQDIGAFTATAQEKFPKVFAGAWLNDAGKAVVALTPGAGADQARKAAESAGYEVRTVAKSEEALQQEKTAFQHWLDQQPQEVSSLIRGVAIDPINNTIAVRVEKSGLPMPNFIDPSRVIVMAPPVAGETIPTAEAVAEATDGAPLAGGDGFASVSGEKSLRCSFGFNGRDGAGNTVNVTAGHCNPNIPAAGSAQAAKVHELLPGGKLGGQLGTFRKSVLGNQDYSIISIPKGVANRFTNNTVRVPGAAPIAIDGVATPVVGAPVCKSGSRTGFSCGVINAVDQVVQVGDRQLTQSFSANICALPGDSGGPIITGRQALGISSASSVAEFPICEIPNLIGVITGEAPQLFAQPVSAVLSSNPGLHIRTN